MVVALPSDAEYDGGIQWLDIQVQFVDYVAAKANSFFSKAPAVILKNVLLNADLLFLEFTAISA
jgi:hypothetical protein